MKQLLFLLLFPCLAMAQYQGNGNQKITLGEQTSADGLVWRGVANDTNVITPFSDTSAYIILDTVNSKFYHYNRTTTYWALAGGGVSVTSFSGGSTGLTPSTATTGAVTLGGTLSVANGGTGATSFSPNNYLIRTNSSGIFDTAAIYEAGGKVSIGKNNPAATLEVAKGSLGEYLRVGGDNASNTRGLSFISSTTVSIGDTHTFSALSGNGVIAIATNFLERFRISSQGNVGINSTGPTQKLDVDGNARFRSVGSGAFGDDLNITSDGTLTTETSDEKYKYNILPINYGLNTILQLKPVNFQWIKGEENDLGFIAQDVAEIIPEAVNTNWNSDLLMRYNSIIPILTKAIQEQQALIKALEQRILILENK